MISIRRAKPEEADILSQIAIAAKGHWNYPKPWMQLWIPQLTFAPAYFEEHEGWAAELEGEVIAFYTLEERNGNAWLENIWVLPRYIGQGVGKELFMHGLARARELGYKTLRLEAEPNAIGFYEKMGMRKIGQRQYELDGQLRILPIMEIQL
jgi:ribosomal protein S18 acetylase RimI-like enzyme